MAEENLVPWTAKTLEWEGGDKYTNLPTDRGGPTKYGVTMPALAKSRGVPSVEVNDIVHLEEGEAKDIFQADYWSYLKGDDLPGGVDWCVATIGVLSGPPRAAKMLQEVVRTTPDGRIGKDTLTAVRAMRPMDVLLKLQAKYLEFLVRIPGEANDAGWMRRWTECLEIAEAHIDHRPMATEVAQSKIIRTAGVTALPSLGGLAWAWDKVGPQVVAWAQNQMADPVALERLQTGFSIVAARQNVLVTVVVVLGGFLVIETLGLAYIVWRRIKLWKKGEI